MVDHGGRTIPGLLDERAAAAPGAVAVAVAGGASLSYLEWQQRSDAVSGALAERGTLPGDRVLLVFDLAAWTEYAVAYLAVLRAGGVAVPLPAALADVGVARVAAACQASGIVVAPGVRPPPGRWWVAPLAEIEDGGDHRRPAAAPHPSDLAEILHAPRPLAAVAGRPRSHADVLACLATQPGVAGGGPRSLLHGCPVGSDVAQMALWLSLGPAPTLALALASRSFDPARLCSVASGHAVEGLGLSPSMGRLLVDSGSLARHDLSTMGWLLLSGRPSASLLCLLACAIPARLVSMAAFGGERVPSPFVNDPRRPGALGRPGRSAALRIGDHEGVARAGEIGRLWAAGSPTGESGYVDEDGFLYLLDAADRVVRWRGASVLATEVEAVLAGHPAVADVRVVGLPDDADPDRLVGAVALLPSAAPPGTYELVELVASRLGPAKAPTEVVVLDQLPRNHRGAVLLDRLRESVGGAPVPTGRPGATPLEEGIVAAWRRVLVREDVGAADDFFELGGDELAATRVLALVEDAFGVRVPLRSFLARPTVAGLASSVEADLGRTEGASSPVAPVAPSQEGMLWQEHFAPGCQNLPALVRRFRGPLDVGALERALDEIVRRHDPLRSNFEVREGRLVQVVRPHRPLRLGVRDLSGLTGPEQDDELAGTVAEAGSRPFDLTAEPLFWPTLLRLGADDHVLVIRVHHSVYDDWSVGVFRRELSALYAASTTGAPSPLADPPLRFADFARRQRRALAGRKGLDELSYWRAELAGAPLVTQLAVGDPGLPEGSPQAAPEPVSLVVPPELHRALRELARRERATLYMTVLAAFGVLVHRHTGQDDLLVASVVANRNRTELEGLIGCFTKKVPLRLRVAGDASFPAVLAGVRAGLLGALSHQDLPFETVLQGTLGAAAAARGLAPHVALVFQGVAPGGEQVVLPGLATTGLDTSATARRSHFTASAARDGSGGSARPVWGQGLYQGTFLIVSMAETPDELVLHARGAFHPPAVERLLDGFQALLTDLVARPGSPVSDLDVLGDRGRAELAAPEAPRADVGAHRGFPDGFAAQVARAPGTVAVDDGHHHLTYAELDVRAGRLAARLAGAGAGPGSAVGVCLGPSTDLVVAVVAAWRAGAAVVPLDPLWPVERLASVMGDASVGVAVAGSGPAGDAVAGRATMVRVGDEEGATAEAVLVEVRSEDPALVFHGSGASGVAPGVVVGHSSVLHLRAGLRRIVGTGVDAGRRVGLSAAPSEDSFLAQVVGLLDGHTLRVTPALGADPRPAVALVARGAVDVVHCTPAQFEALVAGGLTEAVSARPADAPSPTIVVGARDAPPPRLRAASLGVRGASVHLVYGPPECAFGAAVCVPPTGVGGRPPAVRPLADVRLMVLDPLGRPVPSQVEGELHVAGGGVALRYAGEPAGAGRLTTGAGGERLYGTGQRARHLPDGTVELLGPAHRVVDVAGFRVDLGRIEAVLSRCPDVDQVAVVASPDPAGYPRLVAYVVPAAASTASLARLRAFLWRDLPGYAWPTDVVTVGSPAGLAADSIVVPPPAAAPPPGTPDETALASAWADALGVGRVATDENYWQEFSFLDALARAEEAGMAVASHLVARNRTVEMLAAALTAERLAGDGGG